MNIALVKWQDGPHQVATRAKAIMADRALFEAMWVPDSVEHCAELMRDALDASIIAKFVNVSPMKSVWRN